MGIPLLPAPCCRLHETFSRSRQKRKRFIRHGLSETEELHLPQTKKTSRNGKKSCLLRETKDCSRAGGRAMKRKKKRSTSSQTEMQIRVAGRATSHSVSQLLPNATNIQPLCSGRVPFSSLRERKSPLRRACRFPKTFKVFDGTGRGSNDICRRRQDYLFARRFRVKHATV